MYVPENYYKLIIDKILEYEANYEYDKRIKNFILPCDGQAPARPPRPPADQKARIFRISSAVKMTTKTTWTTTWKWMRTQKMRPKKSTEVFHLQTAPYLLCTQAQAGGAAVMTYRQC